MNFSSTREQRCGRRLGGQLLGTLLFLALLLLAGTVGQAQGLSEEARSVLRQGQQRAAQAMTRYPDHFPDQPLWREAIALGERAQRLAPERPEPYRFLGQVYSVTGWYSRAWEAWQSYLQYGGEADAQSRSQLLAAATWLGFNSYSSGDYRRALPYLEEALRLNPEDRLTLSRLTQSHLALGDPDAARPYAESLAALAPDSGSLLERVESYLAYGVEAVDAVRAGQSLYADGRSDDALRRFAQAVELNPDYPEALRWAGRVALEVNRPSQAVGYWQRLVELDPGNAQAQSALSLARNRAQFGTQAYDAYAEGLEAYERGDRPQAEELLQEALTENPDIAEAHALLGRIQFERGNFEQALARFQRASELDSSEASYLFYLSAAEEQLRQQREAQALAEERERAFEEEQERAAETERLLEQAQQEAEAQARAQAAAQQAAEQAAQEQAAAEQAAAEQAAAEQAATEQAAAEQAAQQQAAAEQEAEQQAAAAQAARQEAAAEQAAREQAAAEQAAAEQAANEQAAAEQAAAEAQATAEVEAPAQPAENQVAGAALPAQPNRARAGGPALVLADNVITHVSAEEGGSGAFSFLPSGELDRNLSSPVNFASGTLFQRLEVISKPSDEPVHYQLCLVPNDSISVQPACTSSNLLVFNDEGVFEAQQQVSTMSGYQGIDWGNGLESVIVVIKDPSGVPVDNRYLLGDGSQQPPDPELYYPMEVRFTAMVVPEGAPFPGWPQ